MVWRFRSLELTSAWLYGISLAPSQHEQTLCRRDSGRVLGSLKTTHSWLQELTQTQEIYTKPFKERSHHNITCNQTPPLKGCTASQHDHTGDQAPSKEPLVVHSAHLQPTADELPEQTCVKSCIHVNVNKSQS